MSSLSASLCLFSAALCNVAVLDQKLFEGNAQDQQAGQQQQQIGNGALINSAANLFGSFVGGLAGNGNVANRQGQGQGHGHGNGNGHGHNGHKQGHGQGNNNGQRPPHQSPCPNKFQYVTDGRHQWKGIIRLKNIDVNKHTRLEAEFVLPHGMQRRVFIYLISSFKSKCRFQRNHIF